MLQLGTAETVSTACVQLQRFVMHSSTACYCKIKLRCTDVRSADALFRLIELVIVLLSRRVVRVNVWQQ
jgi:hypothetical protein